MSKYVDFEKRYNRAIKDLADLVAEMVAEDAEGDPERAAMFAEEYSLEAVEDLHRNLRQRGLPIFEEN